MDCTRKAEDIVKLLFRPGSAIILVFLTPAPVPNSREPLQQGHKIHGVENFKFSTEIAVYFGTVQDRPVVSMER